MSTLASQLLRFDPAAVVIRAGGDHDLLDRLEEFGECLGALVEAAEGPISTLVMRRVKIEEGCDVETHSHNRADLDDPAKLLADFDPTEIVLQVADHDTDLRRRLIKFVTPLERYALLARQTSLQIHSAAAIKKEEDSTENVTPSQHPVAIKMEDNATLDQPVVTSDKTDSIAISMKDADYWKNKFLDLVVKLDSKDQDLLLAKQSLEECEKKYVDLHEENISLKKLATPEDLENPDNSIAALLPPPVNRQCNDASLKELAAQENYCDLDEVARSLKGLAAPDDSKHLIDSIDGMIVAMPSSPIKRRCHDTSLKNFTAQHGASISTDGIPVVMPSPPTNRQWHETSLEKHITQDNSTNSSDSIAGMPSPPSKRHCRDLHEEALTTLAKQNVESTEALSSQPTKRRRLTLDDHHASESHRKSSGGTYTGTITETSLRRSVGLDSKTINGYNLLPCRNFADCFLSDGGRSKGVSHLILSNEFAELPRDNCRTIKVWLAATPVRYCSAKKYTQFFNNGRKTQQPVIPIFWKNEITHRLHKEIAGSRLSYLFYYVGHFRCTQFKTATNAVFKGRPCQAVMELEFVKVDAKLNKEILKAAVEKEMIGARRPSRRPSADEGSNGPLKQSRRPSTNEGLNGPFKHGRRRSSSELLDGPYNQSRTPATDEGLNGSLEHRWKPPSTSEGLNGPLNHSRGTSMRTR